MLNLLHLFSSFLEIDDDDEENERARKLAKNQDQVYLLIVFSNSWNNLSKYKTRRLNILDF